MSWSVPDDTPAAAPSRTPSHRNRDRKKHVRSAKRPHPATLSVQQLCSLLRCRFESILRPVGKLWCLTAAQALVCRADSRQPVATNRRALSGYPPAKNFRKTTTPLAVARGRSPDGARAEQRHPGENASQVAVGPRMCRPEARLTGQSMNCLAVMNVCCCTTTWSNVLGCSVVAASYTGAGSSSAIPEENCILSATAVAGFRLGTGEFMVTAQRWVRPCIPRPPSPIATRRIFRTRDTLLGPASEPYGCYSPTATRSPSAQATSEGTAKRWDEAG